MILCINVRPSSTPLTIEAKLSSVRIMSEASFATSLPLCIPKPTSDFFNAAESFTPSPVIATDLPTSCAKVTNLSFVCGEHLAITRKFGRISFTFSSLNCTNSLSVKAISSPFSSYIPLLIATAFAVSMQSPVISMI